MKKEFVDYTEALELRELGFDEPCLAGYNKELLTDDGRVLNNIFIMYGGSVNYNIGDEVISAPLKSQVFRWFREKYDLHPYIITLRGEWIVISIIRCSDAEKITGSFDTNFNTLEEAELACLKKLIQIVKEK
jgi:hypothetical protein